MPSGPDDDPRAPGADEPADDPETDEALLDDLVESAEPTDDGEGHTALPPKVESWRKRSATGAILTGFALGLQQVFEVKKNEPAIVMETSGDPPRDLPVEAQVEQGRPRQSVVQIRPWLIESAASGSERPAADPDPDRPDPDRPGPTDGGSAASEGGADDRPGSPGDR